MNDYRLFVDNDGTEKYVFVNETHGMPIEITVIHRDKYNIFCVPSQYGCFHQCSICHLGVNHDRLKHIGNITYKELKECLDIVELKTEHKPYKLISFMGAGEITDNLELLQSFADNEPETCISIATSRLLSDRTYYEFIEIAKQFDSPIKVHASIHTFNNYNYKNLFRERIFNGNDSLTILWNYNDEFKNKVTDRFKKLHTSDSVAEIHYTLIDRVNDSIDDLKLADIAIYYNEIPIKFLQFSPINGYKPSEAQQAFILMLQRKHGKLVKYYDPPGKNIGSSCGNFDKYFYLGDLTDDEHKEFERLSDVCEVKR